MSATTPVSVSNIKAFKGEIPSLLVQPYGSLRELEDVVVRAGSFTNAGAGWNTFTFPQAFDSPPSVSCQADGYIVEVKSVTATNFLYRLVTLNATSTSTKILTTTITYVNAVNWATVSSAVTVNYMAIEYGGE